MNEEAAALRALVADGIADAEFLAHASLLVDAGVPILISGPSATLTTRVADAFALASPVPGAEQGGREIEVESGHHFEWLADPTGIGCMDPLAGSAPRSPRSSRLRIRGLLAGLDPLTARTALRALGRGFPAISEANAVDLASLLDQLRSDPHRLPEGDLRGLGLVVIVDQSRLVAAHLLHKGEGTERRAPTLLAVWDPRAGAWDDFAWAVAPDAAKRCGLTQHEYELRRQERRAILLQGERQ
ncbi:MAG: hypothetical protein ACKN9G_04520 [Candidatus Limnocylindrus sp.]